MKKTGVQQGIATQLNLARPVEARLWNRASIPRRLITSGGADFGQRLGEIRDEFRPHDREGR